MISAYIESLDEEDLVKCMVAGKQTLEKCKLSMGFVLCIKRKHLHRFVEAPISLLK